MALLDILKGKKRKADDKLKRPSKGVFKQSEKKEVSALPEQKGETEKKPKQKQGESLLASRVLLSPHITEKSAISGEGGAYVFRVATSSNKIMIKRAIEEFYGLKPRKISITNIPAKRRISRGKVGTKPGFKKAVVYLKKGDTIDIS